MSLRLRVSGDPWLYAFARVLLVTAVRVYGRFRVVGADNLPASGPAIVVANYPSDVDPILLGVAMPRTLHFMAEGKVVVLFAEGDLYRRAEPSRFHTGAAFLAAHSGAPMVPVAIAGAERIYAEGRLHRPWVRLTVGRPVRFAGARRGKAAYARMTHELRETVIRLLDAA